MALRGSSRLIRFIQSGLMIAFIFFQIGEAFIAWANYLQNENNGSYLLTFTTNDQGILPNLTTDTDGDVMRQDIIVDTIFDNVKIDPAQSSGFFTTNQIQPSSFNGWNSIIFNANYIVGDVKITIYDCPANILPNGVTNAIAPFVDYPVPIGGTVDISSIGIGAHPCIQVYVFMNAGTPRPTIDSIEINWDPLPVYLISQDADATVTAGDRINYAINYSISYVDDVDTVIWTQIPESSNSCNTTIIQNCITNYNAGYGQNPVLTYVNNSASNGGIYTATGLTVNNIVVPPNSIYWTPFAISAGSTGTFTYQLQTSNSWQDGMTFLSQAHIDSTKGDQKDSDIDPYSSSLLHTSSIITSVPAPKLTKDVLGAPKIGSQYYVTSNAPYSMIVTYSVTLLNEFASRGRETIFNASITDDVSDIMNKLVTYCGVVDLATAQTKIVPAGGVFTGPPVSTIMTWSGLGHLDPGASITVNYTVDYTGCPDNPTRFYNNDADSFADNFTTASATLPVLVGIDSTPVGSYAKGDKINGIGAITNVDDNNSVIQTYGDTFSYLLKFSNTSAVTLGGVVLADKIPNGMTFVSANLSGSTIYYNTGFAGNAPNNVPDISPTGVFGPSWTTVTPLSTDVVWVAFETNCLDSAIFPAPAGNVNCFGKNTSVTADITVRINDNVGNFCLFSEENNTGNFLVHQAATDFTTQTLLPLAPSLVYTDVEETHIGPSLGILSAESSVTGPSVLQVNQTGTYTFTIKNTGTDTAGTSIPASPVIVTVNVPTMTVNGVPGVPITYIPFVTGAGVIGSINIGNAIVVSLNPILPNQSSVFNINFAPPAGVVNLDNFLLTANILANDDNGCAQITGNLNMSTTVNSRAKVNVSKTVKESVIPSGDLIHYSLTYKNTGTAPTTGTYIIDRIPAKTVFVEAYTSGTIAGTTYSCSGCDVYFSNTAPANLPPNITPNQPIDASLINQFFTLGSDVVTPGTWVSPFGSGTLWVAWKIDDKNISPIPMNITGCPGGCTGIVGLTVQNDDDENGAGTVGSPIGTIISNAPAIFSDQLLQAIDNQVFTTILPDPGLMIEKTSSKEVVYAGEGFDWNISYYNDSGNNDSAVTISDQLPPNTEISYLPADINIYHSWNSAAVTLGAIPGPLPGGEYDITLDPNVTLDLVNGIVDINMIGLPGASNPNLLRNLEGGNIRITIKTDPTLETNRILVNNVTGCYSNPQNSYCIFDTDTVEIANPDLYILKDVDNPNPLTGDSITYTLIISNQGAHDAPNVIITDTLPAGACFQYTNAVIPGTWILGWPDVQTPDCTTSPTTLTWSLALANQLEYTGLPAIPQATIPAGSGNIIISYVVSIGGPNVVPGTPLTNGACITNSIAETPDDFQNCSDSTVETPFSDVYVNKSADLTVLPGANAQFTINYGNNTREIANDVYLVDTLPDFDNDGTPDMKLVGTPSGTNGESFYYHDCVGGTGSCVVGPMPTFDPLNPLNVANGWTVAPSTNVAFIAITAGNIVGPSSRNVTMLLQANDPDTNLDLVAGLTLTNNVTISSLSIDGDTNNNTANASTHTPGMDLYVEKKGSIEGGFPGIAPGESITYTITFGNEGTVDACGVEITDLFSTGIDELPPYYLFTPVNNTLQLVNSFGATVYPHNGLGANIMTSVPITFQQISAGNYRWVLGGSLTQDPDICIPPGARQTFEVYGTVSTNPTIIYDGLQISNTVSVDALGNEDIISNNTDISSVTVYLADVMVNKSGFSCGPNDICGDGDDSTLDVGKNELISYKVEYDNIGSIDAKNTIITESVPAGTCFETGSLVLPPGANVTYYDSGGLPILIPLVVPEDCSVKTFKITFNSPLPAPANFDAENALAEFAGGTFNQTITGSLGSEDVVQLDLLPLSGFNFSGVFGFYDNMITSDFDGDSNLDIILPGIQKIKIYQNISTPINLNYNLVADLPTPGNGTTASPNLADFNGDGKLDILAGIYIFENTTPSGGPISFNPVPFEFPAHNNFMMQEPVFKDLDNDGDLEIVVPEYNFEGATIYKNVYNGTPGTPVSFELPGITLAGTGSGIYARDPIFANLDGNLEISPGVPDPYPEVILSESTGTIVFKNTTPSAGNLSFDAITPFTIFPHQEYLNQTVIHDFDKDGMGDILAPDGNTNSTVWRNTSTGPGDINFSLSATLSGPVAGRPEVADFDGDGWDEILIPDRVDFSGTYTPYGTTIWRNTSSIGSISFDTINPHIIVPPPIGFTRVLIANIDGDGGNRNMDVVLQRRVGISKNLILRNISSGVGDISFDTPYELVDTGPGTTAQPEAGRPLMVFDYIDQDSIKDLLFAGVGPAGAYKNLSVPGSISFSSPYNLNTNTISEFEFNDFNTDANNLKDLILLTSNPALGANAYRNTSTISEIKFESPQYYSSGTYQTYITTSTPAINWNKFQVIQDVPAGTDIKYTIYDNTCSGTPLGTPSINNISLSTGFIDISSIDATTYSTLCLIVDFSTSDPELTPSLDAWRATYVSLIRPSFTFQVRVASVVPGPTITNTASITTDTMEKDAPIYGNNQSTYVLNMINADLMIKKDVDFVAAQPNDVLKYTLTYKNNGPRTGTQVSITDTYDNTLVGSVTFINTPFTTSNGDTVMCTIYPPNNIYCDDDGDNSTLSNLTLDVDEGGIIEFTVVVVPTAVNGDQIFNTSHIESANMYDPDLVSDGSQNDSSVRTDIGFYSNVGIDKTGPSRKNIDVDFNYQLNYYNNGNMPAADVVITDVLDPNILFVSTFQVLGTIPFNCSISGPIPIQTLTCTATAPLPPGEIGRIRVTAHINNDPNLILTNYTVKNVGVIDTSTPETTESDNSNPHNFPIIPLGTGSLSGNVFVDPNQNVIQDSFDMGIKDVRIFLYGKDSFNNVYGPRRSLYPAQYETFLADLVTRGVIPPAPDGAYLAIPGDPFPQPAYIPIDPLLTTASGSYSFSAIPAGIFFLDEEQPVNYLSTGSNAGVPFGGQGSIQTLNPLDADHIIDIITIDGISGTEYNFGEVNGIVGNQVFKDNNNNATFDALDVGIAGVEISLYTDINGNGSIDGGEPVRKMFTDVNGRYYFTNLSYQNVQYIAKVTDVNAVIAGLGYNAVIGPLPGADNNAQNPLNYVVLLTPVTPSNITADFGYANTTTSSGCIPSASNNFCCPVGTVCGTGSSTYSIGNLVFLDESGDGIYNNGEDGIPDVEVTLFEDLNNDNTPDFGEDIMTMLTDINGGYLFTNLVNNKKYIVVVTDSAGVIAGYNLNVSMNLTVPGANNYGKDPDGYVVNIAGGDNLTADFGYTDGTLQETGQDVGIRGIVTLLIIMLVSTALFKRYQVI